MIFRLFLLSIAAIPFLGCEASDPNNENGGTKKFYTSLPRHVPYYSMGFFNDTAPGILREVRFEWKVGPDTYFTAAGKVSFHAYGSDGACPDIPLAGTVFWTTPDDIEHSQLVLVRPLIKNPGAFDGDVWFKITPDGVLVEPLTRAQEDARSRERLSEIP